MMTMVLPPRQNTLHKDWIEYMQSMIMMYAEQQWDLSHVDSTGHTALWWLINRYASREEITPVVEMMFQQGATINELNDLDMLNGVHLIKYLDTMECVSLAELLIQQGYTTTGLDVSTIRSQRIKAALENFSA